MARGLIFVLAALLVEGAEPGSGVLRLAQRAELKTFNPVVALDAPSREVIRRLHADLISIRRDTLKTEVALAESWTSSPDGRVYTVTLRDGLRFSDGMPVSVEDVLFSYRVYLDEQVRSPQRDLLVMDGQPVAVRTVDARRIEFRFPKPYAAAERLFDTLAILPRHKLEAAWRAGKLREAWGLSVAPADVVGLGPFRLKEYRPGERVLLERNPYYWRRGLPRLEGLEFKLVPDEDAQLARFVAGDLDVLNRLSPKAIGYLATKGDTMVDAGASLEYNFLCLNLSPTHPKAAWFGNADFRKALSLAVDRDAMVRLVYLGKASPLATSVTPGNRAWYSGTAATKPLRDLTGAKDLLRRAGFRSSPEGLLDPAGRKVSFSILVSSSSAERLQMATIAVEDFRQLGIDVQVVPLEFRAMIDAVMTKRQFDLCLMGLGGGDADPNSEMNVWLSTGAMHLWNPEQKQPATRWEAEIDQLMVQQLSATNFDQRKKLYARVQQILSEQVPMIFLASPHVVVARHPWVLNLRPAAMDHYTLWNCEELGLRR